MSATGGGRGESGAVQEVVDQLGQLVGGVEVQGVTAGEDVDLPEVPGEEVDQLLDLPAERRLGPHGAEHRDPQGGQAGGIQTRVRPEVAEE